ncbi:MAG: choline-sulfatase [Kiritimatiellia bacterium]|jgi:choline-sulfatase
MHTLHRRKDTPMKKLISILTLFGLMLGAHAAPNILFFLVDDQRNDTLGCAGHPIVKTPNVDGLAEQGVRFSNMFVTTAICASSRASIFTGLHERTHGYTFGTPPISEEHALASYSALLRKAGYRTGHIGKYGVSIANGAAMQKAMFDVFIPRNRNPYHKKMPDGTTRHETELNGDDAITFLKEQSKDQRFALQVSFNAVHAEDGDKRPGVGHFPWPKAVDGMYEDITIPPPRLDDPAIFEALPPFMKTSMNRDRWHWRWDTPEKYQTNIRAYFRMISGVDHTIGRVLAELKAQGFDENTVVIYTGDNGYYMGDRGFAGKWSHFDQSQRVPLIIRDPKAPKAQQGVRVDETMALNIDLPATMLDYAGVERPSHYQGASLKPLVYQETPATWRDDFFCEHLMNNAAIPKWEGVRGVRYKYARYFEADVEFLHDLKKDPDELQNLASNPEYKEVLDQMRARTDTLRDSYGGPYVPRPKPARKPKTKK